MMDTQEGKVTQIRRKRDDSGQLKKPKFQGHEWQLGGCKKQDGTLQVELLNGEVVSGKIMSFDKWTITLQVKGADWPETFFKHGITSFTRTDIREH